MKISNKASGLTFIETLISIAILLILVSMVLSTGFKSYLQKARDSKRKQDLNKLARILEDYYNDSTRYPANDPDTGTFFDVPWGSSFLPYVSQLPKDPLSPARDYYYQTDPVAQNFYALYAKLENTQDPDIISVGCDNGCGPNNKAYNYVVHSPNIVMLAGLPNGQIIPGEDGTSPTPGGGVSPTPGGGEPSPTAGPSPTLGPSPTAGPLPTPTSPPGAGCAYGDCGFCTRCGGFQGQDCGYLTRCWYDGTDWLCKFDLLCLF